MNKKPFVFLVITALLLGLLVACAPQPAAGAEADEAETKDALTFVLIPKSVGHPFWADLEKGMHLKGVELAVKTIFHGTLTCPHI